MTDWYVAYWMAKYNTLKEYCINLDCQYAAALSKIAELENPWISVKDKLPPVHFNVLIDCGDNDYHIARIDKYFCWYVEDGDYILEDDCEPIRWMPLPQSSKE